MSVDWFGYAGTVTSVSFMVPQIWRSIRTRRTRDLSWIMLGTLVLNSLLWMLYGFGTDSFPLVTANFLSLILFLVQCGIKIDVEW